MLLPLRPFNQQQICSKLGKAPHNVEGAVVLFGDLFTKAGDVRRLGSE